MKIHRTSFFVVTPALLWIFFGLICPLGAVALASFLTRGSYGEVLVSWTTENYSRIADPIIIIPFFRSLILSISVTLTSFLLALPLCFFIARQKKTFRNILLFLVTIPFWCSFLVRTYAWIIILKSNLFSDILFTWKAVFIGQLYVYLPFMILPVFSSVEKLDFKLLDAASDLGASSRQIFFTVTLPLIRPGVRTGILFVSIMTFGDFVIADLLGGAKFSLIGNVIKDQYLTARNWPFGSALTIVVMAFMLLFIRSALSVFFPKLPGEQSI